MAKERTCLDELTRLESEIDNLKGQLPTLRDIPDNHEVTGNVVVFYERGPGPLLGTIRICNVITDAETGAVMMTEGVTISKDLWGEVEGDIRSISGYPYVSPDIVAIRKTKKAMRQINTAKALIEYLDTKIKLSRFALEQADTEEAKINCKIFINWATQELEMKRAIYKDTPDNYSIKDGCFIRDE